MFDADRTPPALLSVGDTVRFRAVTEPEPSARPRVREDVQADVAGRQAGGDGAGRDARGGRGMTPSSSVRQEAGQLAGPKVVIDHVAGVALLQDRGRARLVPAGVPRSGPVDAVAHVAALGLVGNGAELPTIEFVGRLRFHLSGASGELGVIAACGDISVAIDGVAQPAWTCLSLPVGAFVELASNRGFGYLALAGGPVVPKVLGSAATCLMGGIGPAPLVAGQVLTVVGPGPAALACVGSFARQPQQQGPLRFIAGPHGRPPARTVVVAAVDRIGVRVTPMGQAAAGASAQLPSLAVVPGAIQMLPTGDQVILGPDSGTMGGYPVVGVLAAADLWRLGRVSVGDQLRLAEVAPDAARLAPYPVIVRPIA
jgi:allophanate hydrolase subunit 2